MLALVLSCAVAAPPPETVLHRSFTPADAQRARYAYVPFEVAGGVTRIDVAYTYDRADGTSAIFYSPSATCQMPAGSGPGQ